MAKQKLIKLARNRSYPFVVNFSTSEGFVKVYEWAGSKGSYVDVKEVPEEVVQHLIMNTVTFVDGELTIIEDSDKAKEAVENLPEEYKNNGHTKEQIIELLNGTIKDLKAELDKIEDKGEINFFVEVAKEIKLDSKGKLKLLAEKINVPEDILFDDEENK